MDWHKHTHKHTLVNTQHLQKSSGNSELSSHERSSGGNRDWTNVRKKKSKKQKSLYSAFLFLFLLPLPCCMLPLLASFLPHYSQLLLCLFFLSNLVFFIPEHPIFKLLFFFYWILNSYLFSPKHWVTVSPQVIITTSFMTEILFTFCCLPNLAISPSISQDNRTSMNTQKEPATVRCHPFYICHCGLLL